MTYSQHALIKKALETETQNYLTENTTLSKGVVNRWANRELRPSDDYQAHPRDAERESALRALIGATAQGPGDGDVGEEINVHMPEPSVDYEGGSASASFARPITVDEAIEYLEIDEERWEIVRPKIGTFEGQVKVDVVTGHDDEGEPIIEQEHRVKTLHKFEFTLEPKHPAKTEGFAEKLLEQVAAETPVYVSPGPATPESGNMQRVMIPDIHLGKDGFQSEWGISEARDRVMGVVDDLAKQGATHDVEQICFPLGHDILHIDREAEESRRGGGTYTTTTGGTNVATAGMSWVELFLAGCDLGEAAIRRLLEVAPVHVPIIPGNHSEHSEVAIGRVLMAEFSDSPDVTFDLDEHRERFYSWGVNAFMDTHGDTCSFKDLPLNFATLNGPMWGEAKWREVNTGHKHVKKNQPVGYSSNEQNGCMVRISPSLAPQDAWHARYHYHGIPGAESYIYNRERPGPFASYQRYL